VDLFLGRDQWISKRARDKRHNSSNASVVRKKFGIQQESLNPGEWTKLMEILCNIGVDYRDRKLIWKVYTITKVNQPVFELQTVIQQHVKLVGCKTRLLSISFVVHHLR